MYNDLFLYNIKTGEWSLLKAPNPPAPRCAHQVCCLYRVLMLKTHIQLFYGI